jgi:hypothetical protein
MPYEDIYIYRAISRSRLDQIIQEGITDISYWGNDEVAEYYLEDIQDNEEDGVILRYPLASLNPDLIEPDFPGIEEPLTHTLKMSEEEIWDKWKNGTQTWIDCLDLIGSIRYRGVIKPDEIIQYNQSIFDESIRPIV